MTSRALIVGWGSIGKQHTAALSSLGIECAVVTSQTPAIKHYRKISEGVSNFKPDYVAIAGPTAAHFNAAAELASTGFSGNVMIEKPLFQHDAEFPHNSFNAIGKTKF